MEPAPSLDVAGMVANKLNSLYGRLNYERKDRPTPESFRLDGMRLFLAKLGNPQLDYYILHVTGTKGKGSVSAMLGSILRQAQLKVGVYSSPHLENFNQRINVDGHDISDADLLDLMIEIEPVLQATDDELIQTGHSRGLTFFEVSTGLMFKHFSNCQIDVAVVEVGLGGRLDSTNVCQPDVSVITNVSLDHMAQLGPDVESIAYEKSGIVKQGIPVVTGVSQPGPLQVVEAAAQKLEAPIRILNRDFHVQTRLSAGLNGSVFDFHSQDKPSPANLAPHSKLSELRIPLPGQHQVLNSAIAIEAARIFAFSTRMDQRKESVLDQLRTNFPKFVRQGLAKTQVHGRIEWRTINWNNTRLNIVLDIAHNPASLNALLNVLRNSQFPARHLVFACSRDKEAEKLLRLALPEFATTTLTRFQDNPRAFAPERLLKIAQKWNRPCDTADNPVEAATLALDRAQPDELVVFSGSAFLIAELRPWLLQWETEENVEPARDCDWFSIERNFDSA